MRMRRWWSRALCISLTLAWLVPLIGWEEEGHHFVTELAIELLPEPLHDHFWKHRAYLLAHDMDPDLWRHAHPSEMPYHFIDLDAYGPYPFKELPRNYDEAVHTFGKEVVDKRGTVPWVIERRYRLLVGAFKRRGPLHLFEAAVLAHYVEDAHVPFHAASNYDGQLTGQKGIHSRFEGGVVRKFVRPRELKRRRLEASYGNIHLSAFQWSLESFGYTETLLKADLDAKKIVGDYNDKYYMEFGKVATPIAKQRIEQAAVRLATLWQQAYAEAGKPDLSIRY